MSTPNTDIPEKAAPVVVPADDAPWPGISPETAAALDAIDVDLRGGYTMSGETIAEDTKEFADTRFVLLADLPAIIRAWGSAALPIVLASRDEPAGEGVAAKLADVWPDPFGHWTAEEAEAARAMKRALLSHLPLPASRDSETAEAIAAELNLFASSFAEGRDALTASGCPSEGAILGGAAKALRERAASLRGEQSA